MSCDARDPMVHTFLPFHSLDILSLTCSFCWPYDTKGIVKHRTLMYIMNTLQLECSLGPFPLSFACVIVSGCFFSLSSYCCNLGQDEPSCGHASPLLF